MIHAVTCEYAHSAAVTCHAIFCGFNCSAVISLLIPRVHVTALLHDNPGLLQHCAGRKYSHTMLLLISTSVGALNRLGLLARARLWRCVQLLLWQQRSDGDSTGAKIGGRTSQGNTMREKQRPLMGHTGSWELLSSRRSVQPSPQKWAKPQLSQMKMLLLSCLRRVCPVALSISCHVLAQMDP